MTTGSVLHDALDRSRNGDVDGALDLLRCARDRGLHDAERSLLFQLLSVKALWEEAIIIASEGIDVSQSLARSTWTLRRGLLYLERAQRNDALRDLLEVQKLSASDAHVEQARAALLRVAQMPKS